MIPFPRCLGVIATIQSHTEAVRLIIGLKQASVQYLQNGLGANPVSEAIMYEWITPQQATGIKP